MHKKNHSQKSIIFFGLNIFSSVIIIINHIFSSIIQFIYLVIGKFLLIFLMTLNHLVTLNSLNLHHEKVHLEQNLILLNVNESIIKFTKDLFLYFYSQYYFLTKINK